jgi:hypothetical protein
MISDDQIRSWWGSLDRGVQSRLREVIQSGEVIVDPEALPDGPENQGDGEGGVRAALTELNNHIEEIMYDVERAILAYFELDFAVEGFLSNNGRDFSGLQEPLWRPLADPKMKVGRISQKLRVLDGLIEELELATDVDARRPLEYQLELARSNGNREQKTVLEESIRLRERFIGCPNER